MHGFQITFFTQQDRQHGGLPLGEWLIREARALGVPGATLVSAAEGYGRDRRLHSAHFIELADQPLEVVMALDGDTLERLFERLRAEGIKVFYVKAPVEFGLTGE